MSGNGLRCYGGTAGGSAGVGRSGTARGGAGVGAVWADSRPRRRCSRRARGRRWPDCCWGCPRWRATGLLQTAHEVYGGLPNGFYSLDTMLCEGVFRALLGEARAEGAVRVDPVALGRVLGLDRAPEVKTIRRKIGLLAEAGKAGDWIAAMAARHVAARPEQAAVLYVDGHVRAYQGTRKIAKTHVPRLKFPAPATVETWVSDAAGDPLLVVMAEPAASLAAELRRLIPELRATVGDDRRVLVGFDRGGWSATLFADLHAAGFDTLMGVSGSAIRQTRIR